MRRSCRSRQAGAATDPLSRTRGSLEIIPARPQRWRVGPNWRPVLDDEHASRIAVEFTSAGAGVTEVALTYSELERHGEFAETLRGALASSSPGESLEKPPIPHRRPPPPADRHPARRRRVCLAVGHRPARLLLEPRARTPLPHLTRPGTAIHPARRGRHRRRPASPSRAGIRRAPDVPANRRLPRPGRASHHRRRPVPRRAHCWTSAPCRWPPL